MEQKTLNALLRANVSTTDYFNKEKKFSMCVGELVAFHYRVNNAL